MVGLCYAGNERDRTTNGEQVPALDAEPVQITIVHTNIEL
jgi:hypothetical protein